MDPVDFNQVNFPCPPLPPGRFGCGRCCDYGIGLCGGFEGCGKKEYGWVLGLGESGVLDIRVVWCISRVGVVAVVVVGEVSPHYT